MGRAVGRARGKGKELGEEGRGRGKNGVLWYRKNRLGGVVFKIKA